MTNSSILVEPKLYQASASEIMDLISQFHKKYDQLLIIGHNPSLAELASLLAGESVAMPTCSMARSLFEFKDWNKITSELAAKFNFVH